MARDANEVLHQVLAIWQEVLECAHGELAPDSNFFLNGGDSLQLTRVLVRVGERLGVELDLRDVARFSTPEKMAGCCVATAQQPSTRITAPESWANTASSDRFACSEGQSALWLAEQVSDVALYNTAVLLHLTGDLQVAVLARALTCCLHRHEALRTRLEFDTRQQRLVSIVVPTCDMTLECRSLSAEAASGHLRELAAKPFNLASGPLWRFELVETGCRTWSLLLCVHHCVTDGWSGRVLLQHLAETYNALLGNPQWQAPAIEREFRGFCLEKQAIAETDLRWWGAELLGADQLASWPRTDFFRWPFPMAREEFVVTSGLDPGRDPGITPAALALAALRLALWDVSGLDELCIGMPANVRTHSAQETSIGYFVNLLVLRQRIDASRNGLQTLQQTQRCLANALSHRFMPFPVLARQLNPIPMPSGNPWCDVLFAFQNLPQATPQLTGLHMELEPLMSAHGQHPLKVEFLRFGTAWRCRIEYARKVFAKSDVRALSSALQARLAAVAAAAASSN